MRGMARTAWLSYVSGMNQQAIITEFRKLSRDEKAVLLDLLWDEYASDEAGLALSDDDVQELDRRMAAYRADPNTGIDADEVFREMRARIAASE